MTYKDRLSALVAKGYFPRELPPVFTTTDFGLHVNDILAEWRANGVFRLKPAGNVPNKRNTAKRHSYTYDLAYADLEIMSTPKRGYERRNIAITHPIPQALLSYELARNWKAIQKWLSRQTFSLDEIRLSDRYERSLKGINFQLHRTKKAYLEATSDWLVKTDVSRFYPSIYTHSIAWAAYGKGRVKNNLMLYQGSLADRLDVLVRSCNRNQTVGIPIGPETSRIIAEIISSRIDADFHNRMSNVSKDHVDRLQDDWLVGIDTLEKAESVLSSIMSIYLDYGLEINGNKTSIDRIIAASETAWVSEIGAFLSHRTGPIHTARLKELLSLSLRLQAAFPNEPVINYVLSVVEYQHAASGDIDLLESFLLKAAVLSPISMNHICRLLVNLQFDTKRISRRRIGDRFMELAVRNLENGRLYEAIWLIYTLRGLKVPLRSKRMSDLIEGTASSTLALVALEMKSKGLCIRNLPVAQWTRQITRESVQTDWIWLLAYEGIRHGWLPDPANVMTEPFFRAMISRGVVFYDPRRNVRRSAKVVRMRSRSRRGQLLEMRKIIQHLRGFRFGEY
jgi:Reverse transcriptase (RNA-dependent DNA polymerase)